MIEAFCQSCLSRFRRKHPALIRWAGERLDRRDFHGLPLSLLSFSLLYVALLLGGVVEDVLSTDPIVAIDQTVAQLVARYRPPDVVPVFTWITALGVPEVAIPALLLSLLALWMTKGRWLAIALLSSFGGTALFTVLGKMVFHRPRPLEALYLETSYSFPSGHASIAIGLYGFLGYVLIRCASGLRWRINLFGLTLLWVGLIGLSRIALGVHYLSDVWAGYLLGAGWAIIGISMAEWASATGRLDWQGRLRSNHRALVYGLAGLWFAWYVGFASQWRPPPFIAPPEPAQTVEHSIISLLR